MKLQLLTVFILLTSVVAPGPAMGEKAKKKKLPPIDVTIKVVHATKDSKASMDGSLSAIGDYLKESFTPLGYNNFDQLDKETFNLEQKEKAVVNTPDGKKVTLKYDKMKDGYITFWAEFNALKMKVKVYDGASFIQTGTKWNKGMLIYIISAKSSK